MARALRAFYDDIRLEADAQALLRALRNEDPDGAVQVLNLDPASADEFREALRAAFRQAGTVETLFYRTAAALAAADLILRFSMRRPEAERVASGLGDRTATRILDEARTNTRRIASSGLSPERAFRQILGAYDSGQSVRTGGTIGLTGPQEEWAQRAGQELRTLNQDYFTRRLRDRRFDSHVRESFDASRPLTDDQVDRIQRGYRDQLLRSRSETIVKSETRLATNMGVYEALQQVVARGAVPAEAVTLVWQDSSDMLVRFSHARLDGQSVRLGQPFTSPATGARMRFPGDSSLGAPGSETVGCRCFAGSHIDWSRSRAL